MKLSIEAYNIIYSIETKNDDVVLDEVIQLTKQLIKCAGYLGVDEWFEGE